MWDKLKFWNCVTCYSMYNILFQYTCEIYWCSETVSHVTHYKILCFNMHVRCIDVLKLCLLSRFVQYCFNIHVSYTDIQKLYHMSLHVQYSVSIYMLGLLTFWNYFTCHSLHNILFQYTWEINRCSETVSHVTQCTIFCFNIHVRYNDVVKLYHMSLHVKYPTVMSAGNIQQHSVSECSLTAMYQYNECIITANNLYISCKINSCLLSHWCVLTFIKIIISEDFSENIDKSTKATSVSFKQLATLYMYIVCY